MRTYQKAAAGVALAVTASLTGIVAEATAEPSYSGELHAGAADLQGLPARSLVNGLVNGGRSAEALSPAQLGLNAVAPTVSLSPTVRFSQPAAAAHSEGSGAEHLAIAQADAAPVGDTFAPRTEEEIRQQLLIDDGSALDRPQPIPASSFLTPTAYGADWGDAYIGIAGATESNIRNSLDGSASLGVGFGDAIDNVGIELSVGIISLDGFAEDGIVGFKLHKVFPEANNLALAAGWSNPIKWGAAEEEEDTFYGVVTQRFDLSDNPNNRLPLTASLGVGTGTFRSNGAIAAGDNDPNIFGSLGLRVIPEVSLISSWTGRGLGLAASAAPFEVPLVLTIGVSDITDNTVEGTQFQGALGYSFSF